MPLGEGGAINLTDAPPAGGTITYLASTPELDGYAVVTAQLTVTLPFSTPALSLTNNKSVFSYAEPVRFTATLGDTWTNRKVEIWSDPAGADQGARLLGSGTVNDYHLYSVPLTLTRNTVVTVKFAGDTRFAPRSVTSTVGTKVAASTAITKHYKTAKIGSTAYQYVEVLHVHELTG
ncbi:hypothetical protein [Actinoplanes awajinensis]|uniref:Bacterial Ig-like domain-containing protein n=1 Tax=Actinoplanes awajinensis subsp. mycoplanecinus TaxID=135947 RepID=A0A0X3US82_9ACTN|nr:hypothetical protein [Actinoplanes awajinensis]KUL33726.1 hypothetical protein ADL15_17150 [Actinoplanes awajinensis subsp. mycoplanecinus]